MGIFEEKVLEEVVRRSRGMGRWGMGRRGMRSRNVNQKPFQPEKTPMRETAARAGIAHTLCSKESLRHPHHSRCARQA